MAASPQVTVVGVPTEDSLSKKKRQGRFKKQISDASSTCTASSTDCSSTECKPIISKKQQKKKSKKRKKSKKSGNNNANVPKEEPLSLEEQAKYVALDCEMVGVGYTGTRSIVARVTMIDWNGAIILDEFVQPNQEVTDYRTHISGITPQDLDSATMDLSMCRQRVMELLEGKILIGHALKNDLRALKISHPWYMTRDTAKYEPFMQVRFVQDGILWPRKLKELALEKLKQEIQIIGQPHSAYEDAKAALDLYRLVRRKWEKAMDYKIKKTKEIEMKQTQ